VSETLRRHYQKNPDENGKKLIPEARYQQREMQKRDSRMPSQWGTPWISQGRRGQRHSRGRKKEGKKKPESSRAINIKLRKIPHALKDFRKWFRILNRGGFQNGSMVRRF